jgi:hypothetical protein
MKKTMDNLKFETKIEKNAIRISTVSLSGDIFTGLIEDFNKCQKPSPIFMEAPLKVMICDNIKKSDYKCNKTKDVITMEIPLINEYYAVCKLKCTGNPDAKLTNFDFIMNKMLQTGMESCFDCKFYEVIDEFVYPKWKSYDEFKSGKYWEYFDIFLNWRSYLLKHNQYNYFKGTKLFPFITFNFHLNKDFSSIKGYELFDELTRQFIFIYAEIIPGYKPTEKRKEIRHLKDFYEETFEYSVDYKEAVPGIIQKPPYLKVELHEFVLFFFKIILFSWCITKVKCIIGRHIKIRLNIDKDNGIISLQILRSKKKYVGNSTMIQNFKNEINYDDWVL